MSEARTTTGRSLRSRRPETLERIVAAAAEELASCGLEQFEVANVATRARVSRSTAYLYFPSRNHLLLQVLQDSLSTIARSWTDRDPPAQRVRATSRAMVTAILGTVGQQRGAVAALVGPDERLQELQAAISAELADRFDEALGAASRPEVVTTLLLATCGVLIRAGTGTLRSRDISEQLDSAITVILRGVTEVFADDCKIA